MPSLNQGLGIAARESGAVLQIWLGTTAQAVAIQPLILCLQAGVSIEESSGESTV
jgi:hypothetical protein